MTKRFDTPNATMETLASPEVTGSPIAVWRVEMAPGASGPVHTVSEEQVLVGVGGRLTAVLGDETREIGAGDTVLLRAGAPRQIVNSGDEPAVALVSSPPGGVASVAGGEPVALPWGR